MNWFQRMLSQNLEQFRTENDAALSRLRHVQRHAPRAREIMATEGGSTSGALGQAMRETSRARALAVVPDDDWTTTPDIAFE